MRPTIPLIRLLLMPLVWMISIGTGLLVFPSCKKEIPADAGTASSVQYLKGGSSDKVRSITKTSDGGFLYCGYTSVAFKKHEGFLMKVDSKGRQEWYHTYGGNQTDEFKYAVQTSNGGYIAVGNTSSIGKGTRDSTGNRNDYVVKTNSNGEVEWSNSYVDYGVESGLNYVLETPTHEFFVTGFTYSNNSLPYLAKLDAAGNKIFYGTYGTLNYIPPGLLGSNYYRTYGITLTLANDGYLLIGGLTSKSNLVDEAFKMVTFILKVHPMSGAPIYLYPYFSHTRDNGTYTFSFEPFRRWTPISVLNQNDGYLVATYLDCPGSTYKMQLMKTAVTGEEIWSKEYSGPGSALFHHIEPCPDGSFLLVGLSTTYLYNFAYPEKFFNTKIFLLKVDAAGNELWQQSLGSDANANIAKCVQPRADGGWTIAAYTCLSESGYDKMYTMHVDKNGKMITQ